jgi:hypothetical protein
LMKHPPFPTVEIWSDKKGGNLSPGHENEALHECE